VNRDSLDTQKLTAQPPEGLSGLMQDWPLTINSIIEHANRWHPSREVVSCESSGEIVRHSYGDIYLTAARLSHALLEFGIERGQRVATMAMNGSRHLAAWYGIFGIGAVCHTLNPRLRIEQISFIVQHAGDRLLFADGDLIGIVKEVIDRCPTLETVVLLSQPHGPEVQDSRFVTFETFVSGCPDDPPWPELDERSAAGLCYTSGTTGNPKGVLYSHRSNCLHALMSIQPDLFNLRAVDVILPIVPMYHANAWGLAFSAPIVGAKLVLPGPRLDGASLANLIAAERVTFAAGVPTVAMALLDELRKRGTAPVSLKRIIVGGAAISERILREFEEFGVEAIHTWGMTEMSPIGCASTPTATTASLDSQEQMKLRLKQGRPYWGVNMRLVDESGLELPRDGKTVGALQVKGPGVSQSYFRDSRAILSSDGFFDTGDLATIDPFGFMKITDRAKDIIKSGGEWISSQEIERAVLSHGHAAMAAVIGMQHPKWGERPLLLVKLKQGSNATADDLREHLRERVAKWWLPDQIIFVAELPLGGTGKIDKKKLREELALLLANPDFRAADN
jgi:fatty-acyl-CoA synthase